jgi:hypothetical protein
MQAGEVKADHVLLMGAFTVTDTVILLNWGMCMNLQQILLNM